MNMKLLICAIVLSLILLGLFFCYGWKDDVREIDAQAAKKRLWILIAACNEIWMFLYQRPHPGLDRMNVAEIQNVFDGILLSLSREDALRLYASVKQKSAQNADKLHNRACILIMQELSCRFGC